MLTVRCDLPEGQNEHRESEYDGGCGGQTKRPFLCFSIEEFGAKENRAYESHNACENSGNA
jgi:hypothetical protein